MDKRGQVTVFIIVGVVILILAALVLYLRETGRVAVPAVFLGAEAKKERIEQNLGECVQDAVRPTLELAAKQGGDLTPLAYRMYNGNKVAYLCMDIPGKDECYNIMPPLNVLEAKLAANIKTQIDNCVDRGLLEGDVKGSRELTVKMSMRRDSIVVDTRYDVTFVNGNIEIPIGTVKTVVGNIPFAELYDVAHDAVNAEASTGDFEQLFYMLAKRGRYEIRVDRPYPDKIFIINKKDSDFTFEFAVQGEDNVKNL